MNKCEMCGRFELSEQPLTYSVEYGIWLCNDCLNSVVEVNKNLFGKVLMENLFKHHKSVYVPYNKIKEENKMKAKRDITKKETVSLTSVSELKPRDEIKVKVGENFYPAIVIREPHWSGDGDRCLDVSVLLNSPIKSMTWEDLGYDCFEDMIDDIAKEHGSLGHKEDAKIKKNAACFNAADSYGESYIEIEQNGAKTIVHVDSLTVYPVTKED